tara:strand:- start:4179 stop:4718 length:540 start_codon:yes stop_codon:yes gene_type:complete
MTLITAGFTKVCSANAGGVKNIWIGNRSDIAATGFTLTSGEYSAVTMEAAKVFFKFEFDEDTAEFRPAGAFENNTILVNSEVELGMSGLSTLMMARMQEILEVSACGMVVIVEDSNSVKWVVGYSENFPTNSTTQGRPCKARTIEGVTGKALGDSNIATLILGSNNNSMPLVFTGTVPV